MLKVGRGFHIGQVLTATLRIQRLMLILCGLALGACTSSPREIWIGQRTDGRTGKGVQQDPYDGSTQARFDGVLQKYWNKEVNGLTVNILPGVYHTVGNGGYVPGLYDLGEGWRCRSGWTIRGAGIEKTRLVLQKVYKHPTEDRFGGVIIATTDTHNTSVTVEDLTLDCNHTRIGNLKSTEAGISLKGSNHTIRRVRVENVAGLGYEAFPIHIAAEGIDSSANLIENCEIRGWHGGTGGSITMSNNNNNGKPPVTWTTGVIRNNKVTGTQIGYGGWGMSGVVFRDNIADSCGYGSNIDSLDNRNVVFSGNRFLDCQSYAMVFANCRLFQVVGNTFTLKGPGPFLLFLGKASDFDVRSNDFRGSSSTPPVIAGSRLPGELSGKFLFVGNSTPPDARIDLPPHLLPASP